MITTAAPWQIDLWRRQHRFCNDETPCTEIDEARFVLEEHAEHSTDASHCAQYLTALGWSSAAMG